MAVVRVSVVVPGETWWRWWPTSIRWTGFGLLLQGCRDWWVVFIVLLVCRRRARRTLVETAGTMSATALLERLERPLGPRVVVGGLGCFGVAVAAAKGRVVQALAFKVGDPVPEGGGLVVVAYVGHDCDCLMVVCCW